MKKFIILIIFISVLALLPLAPSVSFAQDEPADTGLVRCGTKNADDPTGAVINPCGFDDFLALVGRVIDFILFKLAIPIAAIMFAYAGFLLLFSGGQGESRTKAKSIFWNVFLGLILAVAAWLIITTLLSILGYQGKALDYLGIGS